MNEEVIRKNMLAVIEHGNETRRMVLEVKEQMKQIVMLNNRIDNLEKTVQRLQVQMAGHGRTD